MDDDETELQNPFPSPPSHYTKYTTHNLKLLSLLRERSGDNVAETDQRQVLSDQSDVPDWQLTQLEKPRVDWILDEPEAYYNVFGEMWFVKEKIPSLADSGRSQLYPEDPKIDRRPALRSILRSLLVTYSALMSSLLLPPPPLASEIPPEYQRHVDWISLLTTNLMAAANDLRPVQARANLESMMRRQLEIRKEETKSMHEKCDALEAKLREIRASVASLSNHQIHHKQASKAIETEAPMLPTSSLVSAPSSSQSTQGMTDMDVLLWAEQVA